MSIEITTIEGMCRGVREYLSSGTLGYCNSSKDALRHVQNGLVRFVGAGRSTGIEKVRSRAIIDVQ